ncbi:MAG: hypothetical protein Crog4KO_31810 [Crocinitomicaceae bacterium]
MQTRQFTANTNLSKAMRLLLVCLLISSYSFGQREKPKNYRRFDEKLLHFGFMLGGNTSDFTLFRELNAFDQYGLTSLTNQSAPGGQLGIVMTMKVGTPVVRLRFIPTLSFQERILNYTFMPNDSTSIMNQERISSTNLDFPLMWQFRTLRVNNFASYFLVGGQYSLDLQSQQDASQNFTDPFIKLNRHDFSAQLGVGVEFFAPYFKFGMEVKYQHGFRNAHIKDSAVIAQPIDRLYNKVWWFSLIFEG